MTAPTPVSTGLNVLAMAQAGEFAAIRELFAPQLRALVSAEALRAGWTAELDRQGPITAVGTPTSEPGAAGTIAVTIPVTLRQGAMTVVISVTDTGELAGLQLVPTDATQPGGSWEPPNYADPEKFDEQDVTVGSGPLAVPGTLSLPRSSGPSPAIVLLSGSGPMDRDSTIGPNKPFKDLAWGLASRGVAVLRIDKVTYAHREQAKEMHDFTVAEEYLHDAAAAVDLLQRHPDIDAGRVFVLGHSLGGTAAPRVAADDPTVAGLVILAGGAQPMHWAVVRQIRYLASLDPATAAAAKPTIEAMSEQARAVDDPGLSTDTPAETLSFGLSASYWLDLRDHDPVAIAATVAKPILLLQGARDYQATVAEDLAKWQSGLASRPDVTTRVYAADNHFFFPGAGPSTPAEYAAVQHLDPDVVTDIATWLHTGTTA